MRVSAAGNMPLQGLVKPPAKPVVMIMRYSYEYKKMCVEMYRQGKRPETPEGVSTDQFHHAVVEWHRLEKACGTEVLRHKKQNKVWTAEEKYELVAKVLAGASCTETAIAAGIETRFVKGIFPIL